MDEFLVWFKQLSWGIPYLWTYEKQFREKGEEGLQD